MGGRILIDGYNLIGSGGQGQGLGDIEEQRGSLLASLVAYKRLRKARITVVFDGPALAFPKRQGAGVEVVFSGGREADSVIMELVAGSGSGATVVTSDRAVASYASARGAVVVSSEEFASILLEAMYHDLKGTGAEDEDDDGHRPAHGSKKGPSCRPPKDERRKQGRIRKLRGR